VQVRFNGAKAWIKISNAYKNGQCGLCGHYNDEAGDEWRMPNNERASSLDSFHRAYAVQEDGECSAQEQDDFYKQNKNKFAVESSEEYRGQQQWGDNNQQRDQGYQSAYSDEYSDTDDSDEEYSWWGQQKQRNSQWKRQQRGQKFGNGGNGGNSGSNSQENTQEPVKKTKVIEYSGMICFSTSPVKQCPEGTWPDNNNDQNQPNGDNDYSGEQQQQQQQGRPSPAQGGKKVQFACLPRSSLEARRLQRQARQGAVVDVSGQQPSFVEAINQPTSCVRY
jgi:hypothetical protein